LINIIADRALAGAYAREKDNVTAAFVRMAANEVQPSESRVRSSRWPAFVATASVATLAIIGLFIWGTPLSGPPVAPEQLAPADPGIEQVIRQSPQDELKPGSTGAGLTKLTDPAVNAEPGLSIGSETPGTPVTVVIQPEQAWLDEQHRAAWRTMAKLWRDEESANAIASACEGVLGLGYACFRDQGNWSRIRNLGLPVILVLQTDIPKYLVLQGFSPDGLLVNSGDDRVTVSREAIEQLWLGEYLVAWPQAPDWPLQIRRGQTGTAVDIVMEMAGYAEPPWSGEGLFDSAFETWLTAFQRRNGLRADGIIGPNTLIYLMAPTIAEPRLVLATGERS